jgi:hypothetical protein
MRLTPAEFTATQDKIAKLNARAVKRGWTGHLEITGENITVTEHGPSGLPISKVYVDATVTGDAPKYDGWTFLARLEWADGGMVAFTAPGIDSIDRDGLSEGTCDHCGINRYRKYTFLVRHDDGRTMQVGSTCLKDFLGWDTSPVWISEPTDSDLFGDAGYGHYSPSYTVESVLSAAWAAIQQFGYVPSQGYGQPTKYTVADILDPYDAKSRELATAIAPHVADAASMAHKIHEWILSDDFNGASDYVYNLKNIARSEYVESKFFGFLVSAPQAWAKAQERSLIRQRESAEMLNEWNGEIGDKLELSVTLKSIRYIDGPYGVTDLYTFAGTDHRVYKWFSSRMIFNDVSDDVVKIRGTVKKHESYQGNRATVLTRCKVL